MGYLSKDTICAIATASGTAAISVIRMSGDKSHEIALSRYIKKGKELTLENIIPNRMYYGEFVDNDNRSIDDDACKHVATWRRILFLANSQNDFAGAIDPLLLLNDN